MRVYRRPEFLKLPEGTIYAKGAPWYFEGLTIKGETIQATNDWFELSPCWIDAEDSSEAIDRLGEMLESGASYPMQDAYSRDGLWDETDLFLVFEKVDLEKLRGFVDTALAVAGEPVEVGG